MIKQRIVSFMFIIFILSIGIKNDIMAEENTNTNQEKRLYWARGDTAGQYGFIDANGDWAIPPIYDEISLWQGEEKTTYGYRYRAKLGDKWGYLNNQGIWIIPPKYDDCRSFYNDRATVRVNDKTFIIDPNGNILAEDLETGSPLDNMTGFDTMDSIFSEGLCAAKQDGTERWGYIDQNGEWVIPPQFKAPDNVPQKSVDEDGKVTYVPESYLDASGKRVYVPFYRPEAAGDFSEGLAAVYCNGKAGFINKKGQWVIYPQFTQVQKFSEGVAAVRGEGAWAFIKKDGTAAMPVSFEAAMPRVPVEDTYTFYEGVAMVPGEGGWGYIDHAGKWVIEPRYTIPDRFYDGIAWVEDHSVYGYINKKGEMIYRYN